MKEFPIMYNYQVFNRREINNSDEFPKAIPFFMVEHLRVQIGLNHGQTIERLAERGGLTPCEIYVASLGDGRKSAKTKDYTKIREVKGLIYILNLIHKHKNDPPPKG